MEQIFEQFENTKAEELLVIRYGKYFGMISKINLLEAYREKLKEMIID
jgi:CIC family chloride channel protein